MKPFSLVDFSVFELVVQDGKEYKGNPNSLDEQLFTQDLARGNPK
jgi:hypothetical protein